jgi:hemerythrin
MELSMIPQIDEQHSKLVQILNTTKQYIGTKNEDTAMLAAIYNLVEYIKYHFEFEEMLMQAIDYPDYEDHKRVHDVFVKLAYTMYENALAGNEKITNVASILDDWVINHIGSEAKLFRAHIASNCISV